MHACVCILSDDQSTLVTFFKHQLGHPTYTTTLQIQGDFFFQIVGFKFGTQKIVVWKKTGDVVGQ